jgi:hypothetical protein
LSSLYSSPAWNPNTISPTSGDKSPWGNILCWNIITFDDCRHTSADAFTGIPAYKVVDDLQLAARKTNNYKHTIAANQRSSDRAFMCLAGNFISITIKIK